jgi:hypothetical protein
LVAGGGDDSGEHAGAGEQHCGVDQASGREIEQHARALRRRPRPRVKPHRKLTLRGLIGEVAVAVDALDLPGVLAMRLLPAPVAGEMIRGGDRKLPGDRLRDDRRHVGRMGEERAEEPHCRELHREPEPVVIAAAIGDPLTVAVVEVEEPLELPRRRRLAVTPVGSDLRRAEKIDRHAASPIPGRGAQRRRRSGSCAAVIAATASAPGRA